MQPRPCLRQGTSKNRWSNSVLPSISNPAGFQVCLRPCLRQGTAENRHSARPCSSSGFPIQQNSGPSLGRVSGRVHPRTGDRTVFFLVYPIQRDSGSAFGRVSGRGLAIIDGGTVFLPKMTNQSSKTPGPPSPASPAGYSQEPLMEQCSSWYNQSSGTPGHPSAVSPAGGDCKGGGFFQHANPWTTRPPSPFSPLKQASQRDFDISTRTTAFQDSRWRSRPSSPLGCGCSVVLGRGVCACEDDSFFKHTNPKKQMKLEAFVTPWLRLDLRPGTRRVPVKTGKFSNTTTHGQREPPLLSHR